MFNEFNNKSLLILGLIVGGLACIYVNNTELASAIFGGLVGYLSHGAVNNSNDTEIPNNSNTPDENDEEI